MHERNTLLSYLKHFCLWFWCYALLFCVFFDAVFVYLAPLNYRATLTATRSGSRLPYNPGSIFRTTSLRPSHTHTHTFTRFLVLRMSANQKFPLRELPSFTCQGACMTISVSTDKTSCSRFQARNSEYGSANVKGALGLEFLKISFKVGDSSRV